MRYAIVFYSGYGQTRKISNFIKKYLSENRDDQYEVDEIDVRDNPKDIDLTNIDHIVIGCPVYIGRFPKQLLQWVKKNRKQIQNKDVSVFMVSLNAADRSAQAQKMDGQLLKRLIQSLKVKPNFSGSFAGALSYTQYGFFKKWIMKRISRSAGGPTDTSRDYEMTNWDDVQKFSEAIRTCEVAFPKHELLGS